MAIDGTILISDKRGRLKPCLRCGYSLRHIAGARNCPECGLAVRVSLSDNRGLSWSNPRWQRFLARAFGLLALGMFCTILNSAGFWIEYASEENYVQLGQRSLVILYQCSRVTRELAPILCGCALCLLSKGEGRYPDTSLGARRIVVGAGTCILFFGLLRASVNHGLWRLLPRWLLYTFYWIESGPWISVIIAILTCAVALDIGKRGVSRRLLRIAQAPLYTSAIAFIVWLLSLDRVFWPLRSIVGEWLFPLSMIVMSVLASLVLLRNAREAESNWTTD